MPCPYDAFIRHGDDVTGTRKGCPYILVAAGIDRVRRRQVRADANPNGHTAPHLHSDHRGHGARPLRGWRAIGVCRDTAYRAPLITVTDTRNGCPYNTGDRRPSPMNRASCHSAANSTPRRPSPETTASVDAGFVPTPFRAATVGRPYGCV